MQRKKENLDIGLQIKELRKRLGLDRAGFCRQLGGLIACRTLQLVELGHQKPSQKVLSRIDELKKSGIVVGEPAAVAVSASVSRSARSATEGVLDDTERALLRLFRQLGPVRRARLIAALDDEVQGKKGGASGVGESGGEAGRCVGKAC